MLRGGRSGPPEMNDGADALNLPKVTCANSAGAATVGISVNNGAAEQKAEHMLHLSWPGWLADSRPPLPPGSAAAASVAAW